MQEPSCRREDTLYFISKVNEITTVNVVPSFNKAYNISSKLPLSLLS